MNTFSQIRELIKLGCISICPHPTNLWYNVAAFMLKELYELKVLGIILAIELNLSHFQFEFEHNGYLYKIIHFSNILGLPLVIGLDAHEFSDPLKKYDGADVYVRSDTWDDTCPFTGGSIIQNTSSRRMRVYELLREALVFHYGEYHIQNQFKLSKNDGNNNIRELLTFRIWIEGGLIPLVIREVLLNYIGRSLKKYRFTHSS